MRMRKKPNMDVRLGNCPGLIIGNPEELKGQWKARFPYPSLCLEIGCGKGRFTADTAAGNGDIFIVAVEKVIDAMIIAMERIRDRGIENVRFIDGDAKNLPLLFAEGELDRVYINFCDPWPKSRDAKFRLTAPNFLRSYASLLREDGEIHFKTDNRPLFDWSLEQMKNEGWELRELTYDLHANGVQGVMTDYEAKFYAQGLQINRVVAVRRPGTKTAADGLVPRLHDSALTDAKGYADSRKANEERNK